jgi:hypothetical protein
VAERSIVNVLCYGIIWCFPPFWLMSKFTDFVCTYYTSTSVFSAGVSYPSRFKMKFWERAEGGNERVLR